MIVTQYRESGHVHATSHDDTSGYHQTYPTGYDPRCSWCWLGYPHTENAHREYIK